MAKAKAKKDEQLYLVRRVTSSESKNPVIVVTIHRPDCRDAKDAERWEFADRNPDVDWAREYRWIAVCKTCKPPSPLRKP